MRFLNYISILILSGIMLCSQVSTGQDLPEILVEEVPELSIERNDFFNGESLWGYMNGGADIYLEYGFQALRVEEFSSGDEIIKLELYKMDDPLSAYGIYSFKTFRCELSISDGYDCLNQFSFQLAHGDYYIQLVNESGSQKAQNLMVDLAITITKKLEYKTLVIPAVFTDSLYNPVYYDIKMIKGPLGIQNRAMALAVYFGGLEGYQVYFAKRVKDGERGKYYEVIFDTPEMKNLFMENNKDKGLQITITGPSSLVIKQKSVND